MMIANISVILTSTLGSIWEISQKNVDFQACGVKSKQINQKARRKKEYLI
jgi:hypothetical protein